MAVERRIRLSPSTTSSSVTHGPRDWRHIWFSPTADGPHTGHSSAQEQGRELLSFVVDDVAPPQSFSTPQHRYVFQTVTFRSIAFLSRMGASTRGIVLGSLHSSVRLHTPVGLQSPLLRRGSSDSSKQHLKGFCAATGAVLPPSKKG